MSDEESLYSSGRSGDEETIDEMAIVGRTADFYFAPVDDYIYDEVVAQADKSYCRGRCCNTKGAERTLRNFKALFLNNENNDVILRVKNREFGAHKLILGAQSSVFGSMFKHDFVENRSGVVDITDCDPDCFHEFLLYLYSGTVGKMTTSNVFDLYATADKYDVAELKLECVQFMIEEISDQSFCEYYTFALKYNESKLLEAGAEFFATNSRKIIVTLQWQEFGMENFAAANNLFIHAMDYKSSNYLIDKL